MMVGSAFFCAICPKIEALFCGHGRFKTVFIPAGTAAAL
jgi:hypothetical protein